MSLKKVFSTIAAAAIAVGGLAIGASAASADEATFGTAITLTASDKSQLEGHTFSAIRLADYASDTRLCPRASTRSPTSAARLPWAR